MPLLKLVTNIDAGDAGSLSVSWELKYWYDVPSETHPDAHQDVVEFRDVESINGIEFVMFDKLSFILPPTYKEVKRVREILEKELLEAIENKSIEELKED